MLWEKHYMLPKRLRSHPFLIFGHRGSPLRAIENTLASFQKAFEEGVHGVELDVRLSQDGKVFVFHDEKMKRLAHQKGSFLRLSSKDLSSILVSSPQKKINSQAIPSLEEVFLKFSKHLFFYVELKVEPSSYSYRYELAQKTMLLLKKYHLVEKSILVSFDYDLVRWIKKKNKKFYTGLNFSKSKELNQPRKEGFRFLDCLCPSFSALSTQLMGEAKNHSLDVLTWVVNDVKSLRKAEKLGVQGIATDDPQKIFACISKANQKF